MNCFELQEKGLQSRSASLNPVQIFWTDLHPFRKWNRTKSFPFQVTGMIVCFYHGPFLPNPSKSLSALFIIEKCEWCMCVSPSLCRSGQKLQMLLFSQAQKWKASHGRYLTVIMAMQMVILKSLLYLSRQSGEHVTAVLRTLNSSLGFWLGQTVSQGRSWCTARSVHWQWAWAQYKAVFSYNLKTIRECKNRKYLGSYIISAICGLKVTKRTREPGKTQDLPGSESFISAGYFLDIKLYLGGNESQVVGALCAFPFPWCCPLACLMMPLHAVGHWVLNWLMQMLIISHP